MHHQQQQEELHREVAASRVRTERLEQNLRAAQSTASAQESQVLELTRQVDAHREEHARQAATILSLRLRLKEGEETLVALRVNHRRAEMSVEALQRENREHLDRIQELENRLRTHLEERESAEQRRDITQRRLEELVRTVTAVLSMDQCDPENASDKLAVRIAQLVQENMSIRGQISQQDQDMEGLRDEVVESRETIKRLVTQLEDEKALHRETNVFLEQHKKECEDFRTRVATLNEEVRTARDRLHATNKTYNATLEELHGLQNQLQEVKEGATKQDQTRHEIECGWSSFMAGVAALLSTSNHLVAPSQDEVRESVHILVAQNREQNDRIERLTQEVATLGEQRQQHVDLYDTAVKRARTAQEEASAALERLRQLEIKLGNSEVAREKASSGEEKLSRLLSRIIEGLGIKDFGKDIVSDHDLIVCRAEQLARLEGEKIVDKTTMVYQLQRKVRSLRETCDRKDLHVDMLRRKLSLLEEAARSRHQLEAERDDAVTRSKRQHRALDRLNAELAEARLQLRDLRGRLVEASEDKVRSSQQVSKMQELGAKVNDLESTRNRQERKIQHLKEQVKVHGEHVMTERRMNDSALEAAHQELCRTKYTLRDSATRERQFKELRKTIAEMLGADEDQPDQELLARLERMCSAQREISQLTRRLDELSPLSRPVSARTIASHSSSRSPISRVSSPSPLHLHYDQTRSDRNGQKEHTGIKSKDRCVEYDDEVGVDEEQLRNLANHAHNHRPPRRPHSVSSRHTPSPVKSLFSSEDEDVPS
ncbi:coiled-coil domain-containing protein 170-like [Oratosquilla oratoria]|uniref:coiled-coil domain-containing protein 170-like n=1 Tax=Oratosquilla oratoria TaxID=337810 RepID=UPI003F7630C6